MTNHRKTETAGFKSNTFKPTEMTPELIKELNDPKGWVTGRLLPKRKKAKNRKMIEGKAKGKTKPKWTKKRGYTAEVTPVDAKTEKKLNESDEAD